MTRYAAFLRGMNLGGRRVTNDELKAILRGAGFARVDAVLASGNLAFDAPGRSADNVEAAVSAALAAELGYSVDVFIRTARELEAILEASPFTADELAASDGKHQVTFLASDPSGGARAEAAAHESDDDKIRVADRCWHWLPKAGISTSELDFGAVERALGVGTTRTRNTVDKVLRKLQ